MCEYERPAAISARAWARARAVKQVGPSKEFGALDLTTEPGIAAVVAAVDIEDLAG